jgi:hypothetical protein
MTMASSHPFLSIIILSLLTEPGLFGDVSAYTSFDYFSAKNLNPGVEMRDCVESLRAIKHGIVNATAKTAERKDDF